MAARWFIGLASSELLSVNSFHKWNAYGEKPSPVAGGSGGNILRLVSSTQEQFPIMDKVAEKLIQEFGSRHVSNP
jgi:hypothetical protein